MSGLELLIDEIDGRTFAAVIKKTVLHDLYVDPLANENASWAAIYFGKVAKIDKRLDAAIVDLGNGLQGFLAAKHVYFDAKEKRAAGSTISELLQPGQTVIVQVKSEAKRGSSHERDKLPRLTMKLYMMGQYLVYNLASAEISVSRKIENQKTIALVEKFKGRGGWIMRAAAQYATEEQIFKESELLSSRWVKLKSLMDNGDNTPRLIMNGLNAMQRVLNNYSSNVFDHIHIGNRALFDRMLKWCERNDPPLATSKRLRLFKPERPGETLFDTYDLHGEIETLKEAVITLPNNGTIIIEPTHALTIIDVNQGSGSSALETNLLAAKEVARQVRLRNMSGAILIDFIGMSQKSDRFDLVEKTENFFTADDTGVQVHGFTRLGIMEITRKRRTATYAEKMTQPAPKGVSLLKK